MQVPDTLRKCVCFVTIRGDEYNYCGSAFIVAVPLFDDVDDDAAVYFITARHCLETNDDTVREPHLRLNTHGGGSAEIQAPLDRWLVHPTADVAVLPLAPDRAIYDYLYYPAHGGATEEFRREHHVGPGEELLITGLLIDHPGESRIMPIVRVGNIAAIPEDPVELSTGPDHVVLAEVRSIGGLSGSPAFVHLPDWRRDEEGRLGQLADGRGLAGQNYLLGLVHGFYRIDDNDPDGITAGIDGQVSGGISVIIPIERVLDIIDSPALVEQRDQLRASRS